MIQHRAVTLENLQTAEYEMFQVTEGSTEKPHHLPAKWF